MGDLAQAFEVLGISDVIPPRTLTLRVVRADMDIDSSANVNWRGTSLNRPDYQRQIPTGIIAIRGGG